MGRFIDQHVDCVFLQEHTFTPKATTDEFLYGTNLLSAGLLLMGFHDSVKDGNADLLGACWTSAGSIFHTAHRTNYLREFVARTLLLEYFLPPKDAHDAKWNSTGNLSGREGGGTEIDKILEFDNKNIKEASRQLGPNLNETTMATMSMSRVGVKRVMDGLEDDVKKRPRTGRHNPPSRVDQILVVVRELRSAGTFIISASTSSPAHHRGPSTRESPGVASHPQCLVGLFEDDAPVPGKVTARSSHGRFAYAHTGLLGLNVREKYEDFITRYARSPTIIRNYKAVCKALVARNPHTKLPPPMMPLPFPPASAVVAECGDRSEDDESEDDSDDGGGGISSELDEPASPPPGSPMLSAATPAGKRGRLEKGGRTQKDEEQVPFPEPAPTPKPLSADSPPFEIPLFADSEMEYTGERNRPQPSGPQLLALADVPPALADYKKWAMQSCHFDSFEEAMRRCAQIPEVAIHKANPASIFKVKLSPSEMFTRYLQYRSGVNQQNFRSFFTKTFNKTTCPAATEMSTITHWLELFKKDAGSSSLLGIATKAMCCDRETFVRQTWVHVPEKATLELSIKEKLLRDNFSQCTTCTRPAGVHEMTFGPVLAIEAWCGGRIPLNQGADFTFLAKRFQLRVVTRFVNRNHYVAYVLHGGMWYMVDGNAGVHEPQDLQDDSGMIGARNFYWFSVSDNM